VAANRYKKACSVKTAEATLQFEEYRDKAQRKIDALQAKPPRAAPLTD
jgi:hypothetical protein